MDAEFNELPQADEALETTAEKNDNKIWIILAVVILVLICCCCVAVVGGGVWLWNNGDELLGLSAAGLRAALWL